MLNIIAAEYSKLVGYAPEDERGQGMYLLPADTDVPDYGRIPACPQYADIIAHLGVTGRDQVSLVWDLGYDWEVYSKGSGEIENIEDYFAHGWSYIPSEDQCIQKGYISINNKVVPAVAFQNASPIGLYVATKDLEGLRNTNEFACFDPQPGDDPATGLPPDYPGPGAAPESLPQDKPLRTCYQCLYDLPNLTRVYGVYDSPVYICDDCIAEREYGICDDCGVACPCMALLGTPYGHYCAGCYREQLGDVPDAETP